MKIDEFFKKELKELKILTPIIIITLIVITFSFFTIKYFINKNEENAIKLFERAYLKISDFENLSFYEKEQTGPEIIKQLDRVITKFPTTKAALRALYYKGYILFHTEKYNDAKDIFLNFLKKYKKSYLTPKVYYFLSYCYSEQKEYQKAIDVLKIFDKELYDSSYTPLAYYQIAFLYEKLNDKENALKYYQKIINDFKNSEIKEFASRKYYILKNDVKLTDKKYFN